MDLAAAAALADRLVQQHGLVGWKVAFRKSRGVSGCCSYGTRTLTFSKQIFLVWDEAECTDTILHEIAHALVGADVDAHGPAWRATARSIGCSATRTYGARLSNRVLDEAEARLAGGANLTAADVKAAAQAPAPTCPTHFVALSPDGTCPWES